MPFTPAHAIVALPFARSRRIAPAAVAAGAVAPDVPLFVTGGAGYAETHAWWGVFTLDVVVGLVCLAAWWALLRPGLAAIAPDAVRARVRPVPRYPVAVLPVAVALGALTHVLWDGFTHAGRFGSTLVPALRDDVAGMPLTSWAQYGSGVGGLLVLALAAAVAFRRAPAIPEVAPSPLGRAVPAAIALVVAAPVLTAAVLVVTQVSGTAVRGIAFVGVTSTTIALVAASGVVGLFARIAADRAPTPR